ncbi:Telomere repeat-binding protein 4, partial [Cucurbita argyrosperma subsp. sororia]
MGTVVGFVENEGKIVDSGILQDVSTLSPNQIADPVVYKLVRVDGDGRFVPATDDEVMEVEDLLEDDKSEKVEDAGQIVECIPTEGTLFGKPHVEISNGLPQSEGDAGYTARLEYIEEVLQKVKQEERLRLACGSLNYPSAYVDGDRKGSDQHGRLLVTDEKFQSQISLQEISHCSPSLNENHESEHGSLGNFLKHPDKSVESESSDAICTTSKPEFSMLKGDICLDNLSIRELHECFKATFGRDTTVKDKSWLKRRIAMGLTNSCDIPASSFIIKEGKFVEESSQNVVGVSTIPNAEALNIECTGSPTTYCSGTKDHHHVEEIELDHGIDDQHEERAAVKRIRKPTRRYIEELSEVESREFVPKVISLNKSSVSDGVSANSIERPSKKVCSDRGRTVITRLDSLGGSGVQVPCVSRVRRSRPRKDIVALVFTLPDKDQNPSVKDTNEVEEKNLEEKPTDSGNASDDNAIIVPTPKGGSRRKHHRAWTLVEVIKLVEGVSICGAGRWSEIKKLSFSSYSYRTSVDLKDKWRNLLKASFAQTPVGEGMSSRKHVSVSIPEQILLQVRELAEMHAQIPPSNHGQGKLGGVSSGSNMHEISPAVCL